MTHTMTETFELGVSTGYITTTGGPNDWDMWLCLRGTIDEVLFYTDRFVRFPPFRDTAKFFSGWITLLRKSNGIKGIWYIEGIAKKGLHRVSFQGTYNSNNREGVFEFTTVD